jgi:hypothetical protein
MLRVSRNWILKEYLRVDEGIVGEWLSSNSSRYKMNKGRCFLCGWKSNQCEKEKI